MSLGPYPKARLRSISALNVATFRPILLNRSLFLVPPTVATSDRTTFRNDDQRGCSLFSYCHALNQITRHFADELELILRATVFMRLVFPLPQSPLMAMVKGVFREGSDNVATRASE